MGDTKGSNLTLNATPALEDYIYGIDDPTGSPLSRAMTIAAIQSAMGQSVKLHETADKTIATATYVALTYSTETWDDAGFHSTSTNTERITIPTGYGGTYIFIGGVYWSTGHDNYAYRAAVRKNGTVIQPFRKTAVAYNGNLPTINVVVIDKASAGDYFDLAVLHNYTSDETVAESSFAAIKVG